MKVKDLLLELGAFDQEAEILVGYDFPYDFQEPDIVMLKHGTTSSTGVSLPAGSYVIIAD